MIHGKPSPHTLHFMNYDNPYWALALSGKKIKIQSNDERTVHEIVPWVSYIGNRYPKWNNSAYPEYPREMYSDGWRFCSMGGSIIGWNKVDRLIFSQLSCTYQENRPEQNSDMLLETFSGTWEDLPAYMAIRYMESE